MGGLGLTGGIADVGGLADCLIGMHTGKATDKILDKYCEVRRQIWHEVIDPISSSNMRRVFAQNPETALEDDPLLKKLSLAETDPKVRLEMQKVPAPSYSPFVGSTPSFRLKRKY
jgi:2-polyprenyl-6-methoxyphenol hydroxylase-like FAD-dependent oxidoreductase